MQTIIVVNPEYQFLYNFLKTLPFIFNQEGTIIYQGRNILKNYQVCSKELTVKSFKIPILINRIAYSYIRKSKARRSFEHALKLIERNILTPIPVGYIEIYENRLIKESYYISLFDNKAINLRGYMDGSEKKDFDIILNAFASFSATLHRKGILHLDYSPGNILMNEAGDNEYVFSLIDINRLTFKKISDKMACKNFDRLCSSIDVSTDLGRQYAECREWNAEKTIQLINNYSDRFFTQKAYSNAIKQIKRNKGLISSIAFLLKYNLYKCLRQIFPSSIIKDNLFRKEKELYTLYIESEDIRQSIKRKYDY